MVVHLALLTPAREPACQLSQTLYLSLSLARSHTEGGRVSAFKHKDPSALRVSLRSVAPSPQSPSRERLSTTGVALCSQQHSSLLVCKDECEQPTVSLGERTCGRLECVALDAELGSRPANDGRV